MRSRYDDLCWTRFPKRYVDNKQDLHIMRDVMITVVGHGSRIRYVDRTYTVVNIMVVVVVVLVNAINPTFIHCQL